MSKSSRRFRFERPVCIGTWNLGIDGIIMGSLPSDLDNVQCCGGLGSAVGAGASKHLLPAKCVSAVGMSGCCCIWCWGDIFPPNEGLFLCLRADPPTIPGEKPPPKMVAGDCRTCIAPWGERPPPFLRLLLAKKKPPPPTEDPCCCCGDWRCCCDC